MVGGTGPGALDEGRNWRRTILVAAPWALAGVLALLGVLAARGTPASPAAAAPAATTPASVGGGAPVTAPSAATGSAPPTSRDGTRPTSTPLSAATELAVLTTARSALGAAGLATGHEASDRWALEVRLAGIDAVTARYAVATVHGLVIEHRDGSWHGPRPAAVGVLLRRTPRPGVVGEAWPLPAPTSPSAEVDLRPLEDPDPSVVAPLQDAGWVVDEVTAVETSDDGLLRISLHGSAPGASAANDHVLWLLDAPGGPRLLPLSAPTTTEDLP